MKRCYPKHWVECKFGDVIQIKNGFAFKSKDFKKTNGIPIVKQTQLAGEKVDLSKCVYVDKSFLKSKSDFILKKGDILLGMSGSLGKFCIYDLDEPALQNQRVGKIEPISINYLDKRYCWHFLNTIETLLKEKGKGLGVSNISPSDIEDLPFPLPPLNEQKRITEKLDAILPKVKSAKARLEKIPVILKKFRQSVLAAACSGRLTEDWREGKDLPEPQRGSLSMFSDIISGYAFKSTDFRKQGVPVIKISNVQYGKYEEDTNQEYLPESFLKRYPNFVVRSGDILIALTRPITNDTLKVCLYPEGRQNALLNQRVALLKTKDSVSRSYLLLVLQTYEFKENIKKNLSETLQPNLSPKDLGFIEIEIPPLEEQHEIVRRVEKLFALADSIEEKYKKAYERLEKLEQAILAKAFRGELVEPDPNDEPAEELIKRILVEKAKLDDGKKTRKTKARKK